MNTPVMTPPDKFDPDDWVVRFDGIEYPLPYPFTPREDARIMQLTGGSWKQAMSNGFLNLSLSALSAIVIVAMQRAHGPRAVIDENQILDDPGFEKKCRFVQLSAEAAAEAAADADPPTDAAAAAAEGGSPSSTSSETPGPSGAQS